MTEPTVPDPDDRTRQHLEDALRATLDRHGHGFQYAVSRYVTFLARAGQIPWTVEAEELPVQLRGRSTHIDSVLRLHNSRAVFMVCECKRVSSALSDWCFVRTPGESQEVRVEGLDKHATLMLTGVRSQLLWHSDRNAVFNLGIPVRGRALGDETGEGKDQGRGALNDAIAQVWRGTSGFVHFLHDNHDLMIVQGDTRRAAIVPAIFTTARLWTSDADISDADRATGKVPPTALRREPWLWLKQAVSPDVRHEFPLELSQRTGLTGKSVGRILRDRYLRCTAIVSSDGIQSFLGSPLWSGPFYDDE